MNNAFHYRFALGARHTFEAQFTLRDDVTINVLPIWVKRNNRRNSLAGFKDSLGVIFVIAEKGSTYKHPFAALFVKINSCVGIRKLNRDRLIGSVDNDNRDSTMVRCLGERSVER